MWFPGCKNALKYICGWDSALDPAGSLQHSLRLPSWIKGGLLLRGGDGRGVEGKEGRGGVPINKNLSLHHWMHH